MNHKRVEGLGKKVVVIGAGIGGLAAAIRLAVKGYEVSVFDKNDQVGGKLTEFGLGAYRFDFGPSLFTMPQYVDELFDLAGRNPRDYFSYSSMPEACRYFYPDGSTFIAPTDPDKFVAAASKEFGIPAHKIKKFFDYNAKIFNKAGRIFLTKSMYKLRTFISVDALQSVFQSYLIELFRTMHKTNSLMLGDVRLVQLFDRYATYNGSSPYKAPGILNSISTLEHLHGTYFPHGGMYSITQACHQLALELGVKFELGVTVDEILEQSNKVTGVRIGSRTVLADVVVSNMDVSLSYDKLMKGKRLPLLQRNHEKSSSAVIFYWGVSKCFKELGLHNIFFSKDYKEEFRQIFEEKVCPTDPTIYINISSLHHPSDAPKGGMNWFVMVNAPADDDQNWNQQQHRLREAVVTKLSERLHSDIAAIIEQEYVATPVTIYEKTYSHQGALYGSSSNSWVNAFLRHPNQSQDIKGLYFVGGSVHPGGGIPLCLLSAKIATNSL